MLLGGSLAPTIGGQTTEHFYFTQMLRRKKGRFYAEKPAENL
jgi:hypothetical protein